MALRAGRQMELRRFPSMSTGEGGKATLMRILEEYILATEPEWERMFCTFSRGLGWRETNERDESITQLIKNRE